MFVGNEAQMIWHWALMAAVGVRIPSHLYLIVTLCQPVSEYEYQWSYEVALGLMLTTSLPCELLVISQVAHTPLTSHNPKGAAKGTVLPLTN